MIPKVILLKLLSISKTLLEEGEGFKDLSGPLLELIYAPRLYELT
jgi:hypothetical protein